MKSISADRIASLIHRQLSQIVFELISEEKARQITFTEVRVTNDHSYATIFYTILNDEEENRQEAIHLLNGHKGKIKKELNRRIKNLRKFPDISFSYDESLNYGNKIEGLLKQIKKQK